MTLAYEYDFDQQQLDASEEFASVLRLSGIADGYEGREKQYADTDYLIGYIEGLLQTCSELQERNEQLVEIVKEGLKVQVEVEF